MNDEAGTAQAIFPRVSQVYKQCLATLTYLEFG